MTAGAAAAVVVAAGQGRRLPGPVPKPFLLLGGRTVVEHALRAFEDCQWIGPVVVVLPAAHLDIWGGDRPAKVVATVAGGADRRASVAAGLAALPAAEWVVVHDGVRPFVTAALIERVLAAAERVGAATAAVPVTDSLKEVEGDLVRRSVSRRGLVAIQTPQAFRTALLRAAHAGVPADAAITDDAELVERLGAPVAVVQGDPANVKITTPADLAAARRHVAAEPEAPLRVGLGHDVHRLVPDRSLVLGGVTIPHPLGLAGYSDADVLSHAITDALLGASGERDLGHHFPPDDPAYRDADSLGLLAAVAGRMRAAGWQVVNVDAVVLAEAPRIAPFVDAMRDRLANAMGVEPATVGIKATTAEGLGPVGRGEGIAAQAVVLIRRQG